jgi:hypothetical protein
MQLSKAKHHGKPSFTSDEHINGTLQAASVDARVFACVGDLCFFSDPFVVLILTYLIQGLESPFDKGRISACQPDVVASADY